MSGTKNKGKGLRGEYQTRLIEGYWDKRFTRAVVVSILLSVGMTMPEVEKLLLYSPTKR